MQKIVAEINLKNIRENALAFKKKTGVKLCAVVKADAYGHGAENVAAAIADVADCFAVSLVEEGIAVKTAACGKDVLVLTPPTGEETVFTAAKYGFTLCVPDLWTAKLVQRTCERYDVFCKVHLKVNTGMNRYGMNASMLGKVCKYLKNSGRVEVDGVFSHLYTCDERTCEQQRAVFERCVKITGRYFGKVTAHLSATYGATLSGAFAFDMVRIGIGLYGYLPEGGEKYAYRLPPLKKAMTVRAEIVTARKYSFGGVGYGEMTAKKCASQISVLRIGYADGTGHSGKCAATESEPPLGNFCMDACFLKGRRKRGKEVVVFEDAKAIAKRRNTIVYEVLCMAALRAERIYKNE